MSIAASLLIVLLTAPVSEEAKDVGDAPPAKISFRYKRDGKPPMRMYGVNLVITNRHHKPTWFITRYWGDVALPKKNEFRSPSDPQPPFGGQEYVHDEKRVVLIRHYGDEKFIAFRLPASAAIEFSAYEIEAWSSIEQFELWEVSSLKVNGKTPLEKWLPYNTLSNSSASIPRGQDWNNLDWDYKRSRRRADYRKETVKSLTASVIRKWAIPIVVTDVP